MKKKLRAKTVHEKYPHVFIKHLVVELIETKPHSGPAILARGFPQNIGSLVQDVNEQAQPVVVKLLAEVSLVVDRRQ